MIHVVKWATCASLEVVNSASKWLESCLKVLTCGAKVVDIVVKELKVLRECLRAESSKFKLRVDVKSFSCVLVSQGAPTCS